MSFVSLEFLLLLVAVLLLFPLLSQRYQNVLLVLASLIFYGWSDWRFLWVLLGVSLVTYACGLRLDRLRQAGASDLRRRTILVVAVASSLAPLAVFKYSGFFAASINGGATLFGLPSVLPIAQLALPLGISFYTFQAMSYTIDVYRGALRATTKLLDFLLFVSFFPKLVAGPLERAGHLLPQIAHERPRSSTRFWSGMRLAIIGYFKKMVIADSLASPVSTLFDLSDPTGPQTLLAAYAFAVQIYCDFSGYTDIARGVGRMLGFELFENFHLPYFATNPSDFWKRWHISLSSWLRDYLYIPLGGNRCGRGRMYGNLMITMLLGGLWHGAAWHFVWWGAYHGLLLILYHLFARRQPPAANLPRSLGVVFWLKAAGFFHLTCLGWLLFRAPDAQAFTRMVRSLFIGSSWWQPLPHLQVGEVVCCLVGLLAVQMYQLRRGQMEPWETWPRPWRTMFFGMLCIATLLFGLTESQEFIYSQF